MRFQTDGLIIKEQNIGEQDKLVTVLTKGNGVIRAFVRSAKNIKNPKCAATQLLCYSRFTFYVNRDTYIIDEAFSQEMFVKLRNSVENMSLAQYFCELAINLCPREQNGEKYLKLILNALYLLSNGLRDPLLVKACVEMRLMCLCGYMPDLIMCGGCGRYDGDEMFFEIKTGKLYCQKCSKGKGMYMNMGVTTALRHSVFADLDKIFSFSLPREDLKQLNKITESYVHCLTEKDFKTLQFYRAICLD